MAITIKGIRLSNVSISEPDTDGGRKITGGYDIVSNNDVVIAKQSFNGYNEVKMTFSPDTNKAFQSFLTGVKKDIQTMMGLEEA